MTVDKIGLLVDVLVNGDGNDHDARKASVASPIWLNPWTMAHEQTSQPVQTMLNHVLSKVTFIYVCFDWLKITF